MANEVEVGLSASYSRGQDSQDLVEVRVIASGEGGQIISRDQGSVGSYDTEESLRNRASSGVVTSEGGVSNPGSDDFIDIQGADLTGDALILCDKYVLSPYRIVLKFLGWSQFHRDGDNLFWKFIRAVLVGFWVLVIITTFITQILSCFRRDQFLPGNKTTVIIDNVPVNKSAIQCSMHLISSFILTDILLLASYLFGLALFSREETEYLSNLAERVFVKTAQAKTGSVNNKWLIAVMGSFLLIGVMWIVLSFVVRILTALSIQLFHGDTVILWTTSDPPLVFFDEGKNALIVFDLIGFLFFDMVYVTAVMNYAAQSEMCIYLMRAIHSLVITKGFPEIDTAIKNIHECRQYLRVLNGKTATATALILFNLGSAGLLAVISLNNISETNPGMVYIATVASVLNSVLWVGLVSFPFIQAARVTDACLKLKSTGPEIRSRPLQYVNTPQIELDSFVNFTNAAKMRATMFGVPVYPWMVWGLGAALTFIMLVLFQQGTYSFSPYL